MSFVRGLLRTVGMALIFLVGAVIILILAILPVRVRGVRISAWPAMWMARLAMVLFNIKVTVSDRERLVKHRGFLFPNHVSYMDIILMVHELPMRFLSKAEIRKWPVVGWIGMAIDTVFMDRGDKESRKAAREDIIRQVRQSAFPPLVVFPEGGIGPGDSLRMFRNGAFEIAMQEFTPYMPCAIKYHPFDVVHWREKESFGTAYWRLATNAEPVTADFILMDTVVPTPDDDAAVLAIEARKAISIELGLPFD